MATANLLQTSVSGGTQNALSLQGDGVFFPKASTASRLALTLTTTDKGFIVYDTTDNNIYFWNGAAWESVPSSGDAGANGSVQYNDNGIVSGATNFVWDKVNSRVGVATATPGCRVDIVSENNTGLAPVLRVNSNNVAVNTSLAYDGLIGSSTLNIQSGTSTPIVFNTNGANESGRITVAGAYVLKGGTTTANGVGVAFPAVAVPSSDANTLDDYEEGTFLPTVIGTTSLGTVSYARQLGRYTKVGNLVTVQIYLSWSVGTGTGNLAFSGLPFVIANNANEYASGAIGFFGDISLTASNVPSVIGAANGTRFELWQFPVGGGTTTPVAYDADGSIILTSTYVAA